MNDPNKKANADPVVRALIVDDEAPARKRIRELLENRPWINLAGECASGRSAIRAIQEKKPDLIFLDIQLGDADGFEVLQGIDLESPPLIIFVTAYDEYALNAFDHHALDYLLKPFDDERFEEALGLARERIASRSFGDLNRRLEGFLGDIGSRRNADAHPSRLVIRSSQKVTFVKVSDIEWIEADGSYVSIRAKGKDHLMRESLKNLEEKLDPAHFLRIHRSTIVNADLIRELHPHFHGEYYVELENGKRFKLSRSYRDNAERILEGRF